MPVGSTSTSQQHLETFFPPFTASTSSINFPIDDDDLYNELNLPSNGTDTGMLHGHCMSAIYLRRLHIINIALLFIR